MMELLRRDNFVQTWSASTDSSRKGILLNFHWRNDAYPFQTETNVTMTFIFSSDVKHVHQLFLLALFTLSDCLKGILPVRGRFYLHVNSDLGEATDVHEAMRNVSLSWTAYTSQQIQLPLTLNFNPSLLSLQKNKIISEIFQKNSFHYYNIISKIFFNRFSRDYPEIILISSHVGINYLILISIADTKNFPKYINISRFQIIFWKGLLFPSYSIHFLLFYQL